MQVGVVTITSENQVIWFIHEVEDLTMSSLLSLFGISADENPGEVELIETTIGRFSVYYEPTAVSCQLDGGSRSSIHTMVVVDIDVLHNPVDITAESLQEFKDAIQAGDELIIFGH
ncbi:MAG: hypothetical protein ATN34_00995 [Epulopiscium sp. Nele67-Bin002]|nr:MAG: hypothetical protein BEN18_02440 [Epulopiscium sp. Nuni2H_MBin001]OON91404.1 MAG: hypothetical protein ATN34_00995 [Epulopiscium sp. Nele67-Bin002]